MTLSQSSKTDFITNIFVQPWHNLGNEITLLPSSQVWDNANILCEASVELTHILVSYKTSLQNREPMCKKTKNNFEASKYDRQQFRFLKESASWLPVKFGKWSSFSSCNRNHDNLNIVVRNMRVVNDSFRTRKSRHSQIQQKLYSIVYII